MLCVACLLTWSNHTHARVHTNARTHARTNARTHTHTPGYQPCISLSTEDWDDFTLHGLLANDDGEVAPVEGVARPCTHTLHPMTYILPLRSIPSALRFTP